MTVNNMINNGFYAKSETFGGNGRRTPGYEKNQSRPGANSRNGYSTKTVITGDGPLEVRTPRDRYGTFEPQLVKKNQPRITGIDNQILSLYAKGMTTRVIAAAFKKCNEHIPPY